MPILSSMLCKTALIYFEDAVQYYSALRAGAEYIVSRNVRDYPFNDIAVVTPKDFLTRLGFE